MTDEPDHRPDPIARQPDPIERIGQGILMVGLGVMLFGILPNLIVGFDGSLTAREWKWLGLSALLIVPGLALIARGQR